MQFEIPDIAAWDRMVERLVVALKPGSILTLSGPLGAGKTTLVQALVAKLGAKKQVQSPTFALMRSYAIKQQSSGINRIVHVDAYRIEDEKELVVLDLDEELADGKSLLVLEWPEKIPTWIAARASRHIALSISL